MEVTELYKTISKKHKEDIRKYNIQTIEETVEQGRGFKYVKKINTKKTQMTALKEEVGRIRWRDRIEESAK